LDNIYSEIVVIQCQGYTLQVADEGVNPVTLWPNRPVWYVPDQGTDHTTLDT